MDLSYVTQVKAIEKKDIAPLQSVVVKVYWTLTGTNNDGISVDFNAWTEVSHDESSTFVPFSDLTEEHVLGWIPQSAIDNAKPVIEQRMALALNPATTVEFVDLPWNKAP